MINEYSDAFRPKAKWQWWLDRQGRKNSMSTSSRSAPCPYCTDHWSFAATWHLLSLFIRPRFDAILRLEGSYFSCKCPLMTNDERLIETSVKKTDLLFFPFSTPRISKSFCERIVVNLQLCNLKLKRNN